MGINKRNQLIVEINGKGNENVFNIGSHKLKKQMDICTVL